jgi:electron transport complex protein RnfA
MSALAALAVFSGLSLNLLLQFGLGIRELIDLADLKPESPPPQREWEGLASTGWIVVFLTALILWLVFTYLLVITAFDFLESFLLLPAALMVSAALRAVFAYFFPGGKITLHTGVPWERPALMLRRLMTRAGFGEALTRGSSCNGLALASLFMTLRLARSLGEALALTAGFSLGALLAAAILREINRRSSLEAAPALVRGAPLALRSMGLLSLIFSSISAIVLRVLGVF